MPRRHLIRRRREIAENELLLRKFRVDQRLDPCRVLHSVREFIAEDGDVIVLPEFEFVRRRGLDERGGEREGEDEAFHRCGKRGGRMSSKPCGWQRPTIIGLARFP